MRTDEFLSRLERVKKSGKGWTARCPAHEDKRVSLSVSEGDDGRTLVKCHAGCSTESICLALHLLPRDLFVEAERDVSRPETGSTSSRVEKTYDYVDENGNVLYQKVRLGSPKGFFQRHRVGDGWENGLGDVRRVLYRLPSVLAAASEKRAIWWPEGEKDADALEEIGFTATTNPNGAGEAVEVYVGSFAGCAWVLIPVDSDESGREAGRRKAELLHAAKIKAKVIDLAPTRDDGYDISDFRIEYGEDARAMLERLAKATPAWPKNKPIEVPLISGLDFLGAKDDYDPSKEYLGAFLYGGERVHVIGPIGHGKTTFLAEALSASLRGDDFLGFAGRGGKTRGIYVDLEMPEHSLRRILRDARLNDPSLRGRFDVWHEPDGLEIDRNERHREQLASLMDSFEIVVIDPWYKLLYDELSDGMANVRAVIAFLDGLRKRHPATSVVVGFHANESQVKKGRASVTLGDASGYKAFQRPCDVAITFQRIAGDRSRIRWVKSRSHLLPKINESWLIDWTRGEGFRRVERKKAVDDVLPLVTDEWQTTVEIAERWGRSRSFTSETLTRLEIVGKIEGRGGGGGRGKQKVWRKATQGRLDVAS